MHRRPRRAPPPKAETILPEWWGITTVTVNDAVTFTVVRKASSNPSVDPEILVRLLWRDEAFDALVAIGRTPDVRTTRSRLWAELLRFASLSSAPRRGARRPAEPYGRSGENPYPPLRDEA